LRSAAGAEESIRTFCCGKRKDQQELDALIERTKLSFLCFLLLLMLGILAFTTVNTFQAVRNFQQQYSALQAGNVKTIHSWMTIPVISHIYHVPENYLYRTLHISNPGQHRHATLDEIATSKRQPVDHVIRTIQYAILTYRKEHPHVLTPTSTLHSGMKPLAPMPGRT
jgi:hypothetical protein